jgi:hypothetical protein
VTYLALLIAVAGFTAIESLVGLSCLPGVDEQLHV